MRLTKIKIAGMKSKSFKCGCRCDGQDRLHSCLKHSGLVTLIERANATPAKRISPIQELNFNEVFYSRQLPRQEVVFISQGGERLVFHGGG